MWARQLNQKPTNSTVNLQFRHLLSKIVVNVTAGGGITSISSVTLNNVKPQVTLTDATTGAISSADGTATDIAMSVNGAAIIPPQSISGDFITIATNAGTAVYEVVDKTFVAGNQYTLNITVNSAAVGATNTITGWTSEGSVTVNPTVEGDNAPDGVELVDLGLYVGGGTSGKKLYWANMNVGATTVTGYGTYFAWGETSGYTEGGTNTKTYFAWTTYAWSQNAENNLTKYCPTDKQSNFWFDTSGTNVAADNKTELELGDDAARAN